MKRTNPWLWIPTLYFAEGIPYFVVNNISVTMFKRLGMGNAELAMYTSLLYLPWVIKPLWSPIVDVCKTKRWWILMMQLVMTLGFAALALSISPNTFGLMLVIFYIVAFASSTHDIAADGFYMIALDTHRQSAFVGIRSTFYRIASVFGQGVIVVVAGLLEQSLTDIPLAWSLTLLASAILFAALTAWHLKFLPTAELAGSLPTAEGSSSGQGLPQENHATLGTVRGGTVSEANGGVERSETFSGANPCHERNILRAFGTFFRKPGVLTALTFLLLFRLPEAFSVKMLTPFMLDPATAGGLGLTTAQSGLVYGTVGVIALTLGGILGGLTCARFGLKKTIMPMALALALPCAVYLYMAAFQPSSLAIIYACVAFDQFGYGFGFTAYMLYMMYFSEGEFKTSHYAICTAFMALSMMLPGMVAGWIQETVGYTGFFVIVMICCLCTVAVTLKVRRGIDAKYGLK